MIEEDKQALNPLNQVDCTIITSTKQLSFQVRLEIRMKLRRIVLFNNKQQIRSLIIAIITNHTNQDT